MGIFNDEFDGVGGSYLVDPKTGKRARVPEGGALPGAEPPEAQPAASDGEAQPDHADVPRADVNTKQETQ